MATKEKRLAKARMKRTGERYTEALRHIRHLHAGTPCPQCEERPAQTRGEGATD